VKKLPKKLMTQITQAAEILQALADSLTIEIEAADNFYDSKSEKWQEGPAGDAYVRWKDNISEVANATAELVDQLNSIEEAPESGS